MIIPPNQIPEGPNCWNIDIASLGVPEAVDGANATLVLIYNGGDGILFQVCSALALI